MAFYCHDESARSENASGLPEFSTNCTGSVSTCFDADLKGSFQIGPVTAGHIYRCVLGAYTRIGYDFREFGIATPSSMAILQFSYQIYLLYHQQLLSLVLYYQQLLSLVLALPVLLIAHLYIFLQPMQEHQVRHRVFLKFFAHVFILYDSQYTSDRW